MQLKPKDLFIIKEIRISIGYFFVLIKLDLIQII